MKSEEETFELLKSQVLNSPEFKKTFDDFSNFILDNFKSQVDKLNSRINELEENMNSSSDNVNQMTAENARLSKTNRELLAENNKLYSQDFLGKIACLAALFYCSDIPSCLLHSLGKVSYSCTIVKDAASAQHCETLYEVHLAAQHYASYNVIQLVDDPFIGVAVRYICGRLVVAANLFFIGDSLCESKRALVTFVYIE